MESKTKQCQNCKTDFTIEPEDFEFYKKIDVPEPTFCPECRVQRRLIWRNERNLYRRKCDFSNKEIFSQFSSEAPIKVYDINVWWSDKWDAMECGREYDFNKPFFEQLKDLSRKIPWASRAASSLVNSDYCMNVSYLKNCYLIFSAAHCENCLYGTELEYSKDCLDGYYLIKCELCFEGFMLDNCYKAFYSSNCNDCQEIYFCQNCVNCQNCFGSFNLKHKKYHIFNKPYSKKEYFKKLEEFDLGSHKSVLSLSAKYQDLNLKFPTRFMRGRHNNNVTGEYIYNCKDVFNTHMALNCENANHCQNIFMLDNKDIYDSSVVGNNCGLAYECVASGLGASRINFCFESWPDFFNSEYCISCHSCSDLFGCVSLHKKQYCILNKQYTKEEYVKMVARIKEHMNNMPYTDKKGREYKYGEFFPSELSPYSYNETTVQDYYPLTKKQALEQGYGWYDKFKSGHESTIKASDLPDYIKDTDSKILKETIKCENGDNCHSSGVFRLLNRELEFYKKYNIPLPRFCSECRHQQRIKQRNPLKLWHRQCMNPTKNGTSKGCQNEFETSYSPGRKEIVYCEQCYLKEIS